MAQYGASLPVIFTVTVYSPAVVKLLRRPAAVIAPLSVSYVSVPVPAVTYELTSTVSFPAHTLGIEEIDKLGVSKSTTSTLAGVPVISHPLSSVNEVSLYTPPCGLEIVNVFSVDVFAPVTFSVNVNGAVPAVNVITTGVFDSDSGQ